MTDPSPSEGPGETELLALKRLDETSTKLQRQGNYLEALECMERALVLRQHFFGPSSPQLWSACRVVGELCNLLAVTYLQQENYPLVLSLLKKAEILTERHPPGKAVTCNNLACYYRRQGTLRKALRYLQTALAIENRVGGTDVVEHRADTYLNTCAVLSQLGRHSSALEHAQSALILLQDELFANDDASSPSPASTRKATTAAPPQHPVRLDRVAVLAIAYHNTGVEQEFLKRFGESLRSYEKGVAVAERHLGREHRMTVTLRNAALVAKRAVRAKEDVIKRRR